MIKRIFKTILILNICLLISLPTDAAVSVSDGSAFVTKAESSASLNNLSNRMAQLENSLDAKIDSLVSAYLTRNGIWNGAKQTIINSTCSIYYTMDKSVGALRSWWVPPTDGTALSGQIDGTNSEQYRRPGTINVTSRTAFTEALTKSGMLYCLFDAMPYIYNNIDNMRVIPQITNTSSGAYAQGMNGYYTDWMSITDQNNEVKYRDDFSIGFTIAGNYYPPQYQDRIVLFFVSKGDVLYFQTGGEMVFNTLSTDDGCRYFGRKWTFKDLQIY